MKAMKKLLVIALTLFALTSAIQPAFAANKVSASFVTAKTATVYTGSNDYAPYEQDNSTYKYTIYKYKAPADGYLKFTMYDTELIRVYFSSADAKDVSDDWYENVQATVFPESPYFPVTKGQILYLRPEGAYKFKFSIAKQAVAYNFCRALATPLNAGESALVLVPKDHFYDRYYKITLTQAQVVKITYKNLMGGYAYETPEFSLLDASGRWMDYPTQISPESPTYKTRKLKAGTYYIRCDIGITFGYEDYGGEENQPITMYKLSWR